jgi:peptide/nickel transport system substrate-binding protein
MTRGARPAALAWPTSLKATRTPGCRVARTRRSRFVRGHLPLLAAAVSITLSVGGCGSSSGTGGDGSPASKVAKAAGRVTLLMGSGPDYLDPQLGYSTQSVEATWIAYVGLYTYAHAEGPDGGKVIPGVAEDYPKVSKDGTTYTITLRKGLKYSNGAPVKASDFLHTVQRAEKLNWPNKSFLTTYIKGAQKYDDGKAGSISGITTDDKAGRITIKLTQPYGAFLNVLSFPATGLVPSGTKMKNLSNDPPPGVGPYRITDVVPNRSFRMVRNPDWTDDSIPGVPAGKVDIDVKIASNTQTEAQQVLDNQADVFDWADQLPPALAPQIKARASDRFAMQDTISTFYFFLNTQTKPFNNQLARAAVNYAIDRRAISRLNGGNFKPTCWFLPEGMPGRPSGPCPYGDPEAEPDLEKARELVKQSGMLGEPVTVWGQNRSPRKEIISYYTEVLNKIGFKAESKIVADAQYFPTIGNLSVNPQTGWGNWYQDFLNPSNFYQLLNRNTIQPVSNANLSQVDDPRIQHDLAELTKVPGSDLDSVVDRWEALEKYVADKAYVAVFGQQRVPQFFSERVDFDAAVFHPVYGHDFTSFRLK